VNLRSLSIEYLHEVDDCWFGDVIGYWCNGHVDKNIFFIEASHAHLELHEKDNCVPFTLSNVEHKYYRYPTNLEIEQGDYVEHEFIFVASKEFELLDNQDKAKYETITVIEL
jgi:hypothetical protein